MQLSGNTILITGGATGIGFALAEALIKAGNTVIITGRRLEKLAEAQKRLPGLHVKACDVADPVQRAELVRWVTAEFADLNVLINNAGIQRNINLQKGVEELLAGEDELKVNLEAPIMLAALLIPHLKGKANAAIINVTSGLAFSLSAKAPIYSTTKAALHAFSTVLRHQLKPLNIKVYEVVPPLILDTELNPTGRAADREAAGGVADSVRFAHLNLPTTAVFAEAVLTKLADDVTEIGYGTSEAALRASKQELDELFRRMNP